MESGFIEQQALKFVKGKKAIGISLIVMGVLFLALTVSMYLYFQGNPEDAEYATLSAVFFAIPGIILLLVSIPQFLKAAKATKQICEYATLTVLSDNRDKKNAAKIINEDIAQGNIQVELHPFRYAKDNKVMLLPSYLLFCQHIITAVPIDKIYWVFVNRQDVITNINGRTVALKGYVVGIAYCEEIYYMGAKNETHAKSIVAELDKYIPNVMGKYNMTLEKLFRKNHTEFLRIYYEKTKS